MDMKEAKAWVDLNMLTWVINKLWITWILKTQESRFNNTNQKKTKKKKKVGKPSSLLTSFIFYYSRKIMALGFSIDWRCSTISKRRSLCYLDRCFSCHFWCKFIYQFLNLFKYRVTIMKDNKRVSNISMTPMYWMLTHQDGSNQRSQVHHHQLVMVIHLCWQDQESSYLEVKAEKVFWEICMPWTQLLWLGIKGQKVVAHHLLDSTIQPT